MATPRVLILRAPGTNCDVETAHAFEVVGAKPVSIHVNQLIEDSSAGQDCQILCFPGGFSYGDDIAAGRILAQRLQVHLKELIDQFCTGERLVLGICNGFQIMMRLGLFFPPEVFPDARSAPPATLTSNVQSRFEDRWVWLRNVNDKCVFLRDVETMFLPMAHAEGRFLTRDSAAADRLDAGSQLCLRYCTEAGDTSDQPLPFPANPNGADRNVAGICDPSGRVFGLMPHPERYLEATNHPSWTREKELPEKGAGLQVFENAVSYFA